MTNISEQARPGGKSEASNSRRLQDDLCDTINLNRGFTYFANQSGRSCLAFFDFEDTTPPLVPVPTHQNTYQTDSPIFEGTASDPDSDIVQVLFQIDGGDWESATPDDGAFDSNNEGYTISTSDLPPGSHTIIIRAVNAFGLSSDVSFTFEIEEAEIEEPEIEEPDGLIDTGTPIVLFAVLSSLLFATPALYRKERRN